MVIATAKSSRRQDHLTVRFTWQMSTQPNLHQQQLRERHPQVLTTGDLRHQWAQTGRHLHGEMTEEDQVAVWQLKGQEMATGVHSTHTIRENLPLSQRNHHHLVPPDTVHHMARVLPRRVGHHRTDGAIPRSLVQVQEVRVLVIELENQPRLLQRLFLV